MRNCSAEYEAEFTEQFAKDIKRVGRRSAADVKHIKKVVDRILRSPDNHDGGLKGALAGYFKKYVGRSGYRIVYRVCGECRRMGKDKEGPDRCEFCEDTSDDTVVFFRVKKKTGRSCDYEL